VEVIFSVKAGKTSVPHARDLRAVLDREDTEVGVLISLQEPTQPMRSEAASAGQYKLPGWNKNYPRTGNVHAPGRVPPRSSRSSILSVHRSKLCHHDRRAFECVRP
jgi:hypothetical protein